MTGTSDEKGWLEFYVGQCINHRSSQSCSCQALAQSINEASDKRYFI